jgi:2-dehydro-3-deoxygalactonokinase
VLVASGALAALYRQALDLAGLAVRTVDADEAVRAGLIEAARENGMIQMNKTHRESTTGKSGVSA